jgi:TPR repeat protein
MLALGLSSKHYLSVMSTDTICCPPHLVLQVAQQSSGTACLWLGQLSERGLGLPAPDYVDAGAWFGRGAALGHLECAHALAFYYQHGLGELHNSCTGSSSICVS